MWTQLIKFSLVLRGDLEPKLYPVNHSHLEVRSQSCPPSASQLFPAGFAPTSQGKEGEHLSPLARERAFMSPEQATFRAAGTWGWLKQPLKQHPPGELGVQGLPPRKARSATHSREPPFQCPKRRAQESPLEHC